MNSGQQIRLRDLSSLITKGTTPKTLGRSYVDAGIPFVRAEDVYGIEINPASVGLFIDEATHKMLRRSVIKPGDLLITIAGSVGRIAFVGDRSTEMNCNQAVAIVRLDQSRICPRFACFVGQSYNVAEQIRGHGTTATITNLSLQQIGDLTFSLPPLDEQRRIVDLLERAAGIRRLREQALAKARAIVPALFLDMFGDPGSNPKGWPVTKLGEILAAGPQNGLYRPSSDYGDGIRILRINSFDDGKVSDIKSLRRLQIDEETTDRYGLLENDIVINRVNSPPQLGKSVLVPPLLEPVVFESNMMRLRVDESRLLPAVAIEMLQLKPVRRNLTRNAKHAINQSSINQTDVRSIRVLLMPLGLQQTFVSRLADLRSIIAQQERSLAVARELERSLMGRLLG